MYDEQHRHWTRIGSRLFRGISEDATFVAADLQLGKNYSGIFKGSEWVFRDSG
jgi:hypothetical protein